MVICLVNYFLFKSILACCVHKSKILFYLLHKCEDAKVAICLQTLLGSSRKSAGIYSFSSQAQYSSCERLLFLCVSGGKIVFDQH